MITTEILKFQRKYPQCLILRTKIFPGQNYFETPNYANLTAANQGHTFLIDCYDNEIAAALLAIKNNHNRDYLVNQAIKLYEIIDRHDFIKLN